MPASELSNLALLEQPLNLPFLQALNPSPSSSGTGLLAALDAVSYKKEIVVVTISGTYHVEMLLQLREDFEELGIGHFLILTMSVGARLWRQLSMGIS